MCHFRIAYLDLSVPDDSDQLATGSDDLRDESDAAGILAGSGTAEEIEVDSSPPELVKVGN